MEEVDKIILHSLRQIGCDLDEDITCLKQFDSDMIVKAAVCCLEHIQPDLGLPRLLPQNMAAKYRVGQDIAQACMDSGYPGDIGYQTFLYSGEADVRRILMFLIDKLPKEQEKFVHEPSGPELFLRRIKCKVKEAMEKPWLPYNCCYDNKISSFLPYTNINSSPKTGWNEFKFKDLPSGSIDETCLIPTLIALHSRGILQEHEPHWYDISKDQILPNITQSQLASKFIKETVSVKKPPIAPKPKLKDNITLRKLEDENESKRKEEQEDHILTEDFEQLVESVKQLQIKKLQLLQEMEKEEKDLKEEEEKDSLRSKIVEFLSDGEGNVAKLQKIIESDAQRLVALASQWEKHRVPLIEKYRKYLHLHSNRVSETVKKAETVKSLSEKRKELETELRNKDQILAQLQSENEKNGKEVNRSAYTRRIMEIISNIEKQKTEIEKVLKDTRDVQKEINILSGQLDRSFTVADETIFRDAKKDETSRKAYKLLATLHSDCDQLVAMVQETGAILREIRDLEDQIEKERSKNIAANLERITADLNQMKVESTQLSARLKARQQNS